MIEYQFDYRTLDKEEVVCPICSNAARVPIVRGDRYDMGLQTVVCAECGMVFTSPRPTAAALKAFYQTQYRIFYESVDRPDAKYLQEKQVEVKASDIWQASRTALQQLMDERSELTVLDIGCAEGSLLRLLRKEYKHRVNLVGIEPSAAFADHARTWANSRVLVGEFDHAMRQRVAESIPPADVVFLSHVLEHVLEPMAFLKRIASSMKENSLLVVEVPDILGNWSGIGMFHLAHVLQFHRRTLELALATAGFEPIAPFVGGSELMPWKMTCLASNIAVRVDQDSTGSSRTAVAPTDIATEVGVLYKRARRGQRSPDCLLPEAEIEQRIVAARRAPVGKSHATTGYQHAIVFVETGPNAIRIQRLISTHPECFCTELRLLGDLFDVVNEHEAQDGRRTVRRRVSFESFVQAISSHLNLAQIPADSGDVCHALVPRLADATLNYLAALSGKRILVDRASAQPNRAVFDGYGRMFPDARRVYVMTDGRDVVCRRYTNWINTTVWDDEPDATKRSARRFLLREGESQVRRLFDDSEIRRLASAWARNVALFSTQCELVIRSEDLLAKGHTGLTRLLGFLGACVDDHSMCAVLALDEEQAPDTKSRSFEAGTWREHFTRRDGELFHEVAGATLLDHGYEQDATWYSDLREELR